MRIERVILDASPLIVLFKAAWTAYCRNCLPTLLFLTPCAAKSWPAAAMTLPLSGLPMHRGP